MNEAETRAEQIAPALKAVGWGVVEGSRILREYTLRPWATSSPNAPSGSKLDSVGCSF